MLETGARAGAGSPRKRGAGAGPGALEGQWPCLCWQCLAVFLLQGHPGRATCPQQPCATGFSRRGAVLVAMTTGTGHMTRSTF